MPVDVMLSDIDMPELNGLQFHSKMMKIPVCVFISAYPDYAADSFEMEDFFLLNKFAHALYITLPEEILESIFSSERFEKEDWH